MKRILFIILITFSLYNSHVSTKEAILLVGGVFGSEKSMHAIKKYFEDNYDYDAYPIFYLNRKSLEISYKNIVNEINKIDLAKYNKIHIFCHIFGGRMMLRYFKEYDIPNMDSIIFDRGPIEEELGIVVRDIGGEDLIKLYGGKNLLEFTYMETFKIPENLKDNKIGIIIETKAIKACYLYRRHIKKNKPSFNPKDLLEQYNDYYFIDLHHKDMYTKIEVFGDKVHNFFQTGYFGSDVNRELRDYLSEF